MSSLLYSYKDSAGTTEDAIESHVDEITSYTQNLIDSRSDAQYSRPESSVRLPYDADQIFEVVKGMAEKKSYTSVRYCVIVGIGGSSMGARAVYSALQRSSDNETELIFLETVSPTRIRSVLDTITEDVDSSDELLINVVSKSGTTTETITNFETLFSILSDAYSDLTSRVVVTTDYQSPLWLRAKKNDIDRLPIPANVGGRYSVLSPVGLFPLFVGGIDIESLLEGARELLANTLSTEEVTDNMPFIAAATSHYHAQNGNTVQNTFLFNPELTDFGAWYRQLAAESLGKISDVGDEEDQFENIIPIISVATTDLHSVGQLYFGGRHNTFTTFVRYQYESKMQTPKTPLFEGLVDGIANRKVAEVMEAIYQSVIESYAEEDLPFAQIELPVLDAYHVGQLLQFNMLKIMYQAKLMKVNAFNQPAVEGYKEKTRAILKSRVGEG